MMICSRFPVNTIMVAKPEKGAQVEGEATTKPKFFLHFVHLQSSFQAS